jgi:hypothetical protein
MDAVAGENPPEGRTGGKGPRSAAMTSRRSDCRSASLPECSSAMPRVR